MDPIALGDQSPDALIQLVVSLKGGHRRHLSEAVDAEGDGRLAQSRGDGLMGHRVPDAQAREPVRLGEGAQHDDVRMPRCQHARTVDRVGVGDELGVGLVEDDEHVTGDAREERVERRLRDDRAGRVVRGADDDHAGAVGDGIRHRVEIVAACGVIRHRHRGRPRDDGETRVGLERAPREQDLVAGTARGLRELEQDRHRARRHMDVVVGDVEALGEAGAQPRRGGIRIPVEAVGGLHRLHDTGQRVERVLVAGELERVGAGLFALLVGGQRRDLGTDAHGQVGKVAHASSLRGRVRGIRSRHRAAAVRD